ncbi:unnamed protein product [Pylaiella littoralis]
MVSKRTRKSRKKQCELGSSCPYQHEYQHQLEFAHDGSNTTTTTTTGNSSPAVRGGQRVRAGDTGGKNINPVNGTGSRGRKVAVSADRRRAERTLRQEEGVGQGTLGASGDDAREAQRTRWIKRKQQEIEQQQQQQLRRAADSARGGARSGRLPNAGDRSGTRRGSRTSPPPDCVQPVFSPPRTNSHASSSSLFGLRQLASGSESESESALPQTGRRSNSTVDRQRASPSTPNEQGGADREQGRDHSREVICVDSDADDN